MSFCRLHWSQARNLQSAAFSSSCLSKLIDSHAVRHRLSHTSLFDRSPRGIAGLGYATVAGFGRSYSPIDIDRKWRPRWSDHAQWTMKEAPNGPFYALPMFPYPSGSLHIGHLRVYTISDVIARYRRMSGYSVLHPIGWDAFGLPAENAAIERGVDPAEWTSSNIEHMKQQIETMGGLWSWSAELRTCDPQFYRDTQRLFLRLYEKGLAYQQEADVNWDPVDLTVLANEQVDSNGCSWRSGAKVEKRPLKQWFFKITEFREQLLKDLDKLAVHNAWPQRVLSMQRNWIGKSSGATIKFETSSPTGIDMVEVFTTRPDTLYGVQYLALALNHPIVLREASSNPSLQEFLQQAHQMDADAKEGYRLDGVSASNPVLRIHLSDQRDGAQSIPVFVAPYVLGDYGTKAVMGVPAHDTRDFEFWQLNRGDDELEPRKVIESAGAPSSARAAFTAQGKLTAICGPYAGQTSRAAASNIMADLQRSGLGAVSEQWRLRDWLISRQRYWGTPIPVVHCETCGVVPVPEDQLPVELPRLTADIVLGQKGNLLEKLDEWKATECPRCHHHARRETDTMDTFVDSSWYYYHFAETSRKHNQSSASMPVDIYIGGVEHAILHLLYARFIAKCLGSTSSGQNGPDPSLEPFKRLLTQGMVHGKTYSDPDTGRFLKPDEVETSISGSVRIIESGKRPNISYEKMSKSKYNGVDPIACMEKYGADTVRAHILFQAPVGDVLDWDEEKIVGIERWFRKIWNLCGDPAIRGYQAVIAQRPNFDVESEARLWEATQRAIVSVTQSYHETFALNTVVSDLMSLTNVIIEASSDDALRSSPTGLATLYKSVNMLLRLLVPIGPSFAEECWTVLHDQTEEAFDVSNTASRTGIPVPDGSLDQLQKRSQPCAFQVNGKLKFAIRIPTPPDALSGEALQAWVLDRIVQSGEGQRELQKGNLDLSKAKRIIVVKRGRTVNVVI